MHLQTSKRKIQVQNLFCNIKTSSWFGNNVGAFFTLRASLPASFLNSLTMFVKVNQCPMFDPGNEMLVDMEMEKELWRTTASYLKMLKQTWLNQF